MQLGNKRYWTLLFSVFLTISAWSEVGINADDFFLIQNDKSIILKGNVFITFTDESLRIQSNTLKNYVGDGLYEGDVKIILGDLVLSADRVVLTSDQTNAIKSDEPDNQKFKIQVMLPSKTRLLKKLF